jgi:putative ABC transport system permease protein
MELRPIISAMLRQRTGPLLVALQVAISLAVLANALFIVQQRIAVSQRPSGIADEQDVGYVAVAPLQRRAHNEALAEQKREKEAIAAVPGVVSVAWANQMPLSLSGGSSSVRAAPGQAHESAQPDIFTVQDGFIRTLGLKLVEGRDFEDAEFVEYDPLTMDGVQGFPHSVIVTRALARAVFPDAPSAVGKVLYFGLGAERYARIVGVVDTLQTHFGAPGTAGELSLVMPRRMSVRYSGYAIRAAPGQIDRVLGEAAEALRKAAPTPVTTATHTVSEYREKRYRNERALAWMLIAISALLLLVTASGIVGMTALRVDQRRKQIGVRRALGARWRDILRYFIVENIVITSGGIVAGLLAAVALNRVLMAQLDMARLPLEYLALGAAALWALGIAAVYGPASRAASISPAIATRTA